MKALKSKVMIMANALVKQGFSRSAAMIKAWALAKLRRFETGAAGVTFNRRQTLLDHLTRYAAEDITIELRREADNAADKNAVQIIAAVKGKGSAVVGYLNRHCASMLAPLPDKGRKVLSKFSAITGGGDGYNYGLNIELTM